MFHYVKDFFKKLTTILYKINIQNLFNVQVLMEMELEINYYKHSSSFLNPIE